MNPRNKKFVDGILTRAQVSDVAAVRVASASSSRAARIPYGFSKRRPEIRRVPFGKFGRFLLVSKASLIFLLVMSVVPMTAFEAHVVNVTATIERRPCVEYEVRSLGFWRTHADLWLFPQTLGAEIVATSTDAVAVFGLPNSSMRNKLKKELLALKFNIAHFGAGSGLVPGESVMLNDLAGEADALLTQDPPPSNHKLEKIKNRVESVNTSYKVSTCPPEDGGSCSKDDPPTSPHTQSLMQSASLVDIGDPSEENINTGNSTTTVPETDMATSTENFQSQEPAITISESLENHTATSTDQTSENNGSENVLESAEPHGDNLPVTDQTSTDADSPSSDAKNAADTAQASAPSSPQTDPVPEEPTTAPNNEEPSVAPNTNESSTVDTAASETPVLSS